MVRGWYGFIFCVLHLWGVGVEVTERPIFCMGEGEAAKVKDQERGEGELPDVVCEGYREAGKRGDYEGEIGGEGEGML